MVVGNQSFLDLEEQASQLLNELAILRSETESYASADRELREATAGIVALMSRFEDVASTVKEVALALREIGTPQLLSEQQALASLMDNQRSALEQLSSGLAQHTQTTIAEIDDRLTLQTASLENHRSEIARLTSSAGQQHQHLLSTLDDRLAYHVSMLEQTDRRVAQVETSLTELRGLLTTQLASTLHELQESLNVSQRSVESEIGARFADLVEQATETSAGLRRLRVLNMVFFALGGILIVTTLVVLLTSR